MTELLALFGNIWVRRAALAVVVVIALLAVRQHYINLGKSQGRQTEQQHSIQQTEQSHAGDRDQVLTVLNTLQLKVEASERRQETLTQALLQLATRQQQAKQEVAGMTPEQLDAVLAKYTKRELADCVNQLPICEATRDRQAEKISEIEGEVATLDQKFSTLASYTGRLEGYYVAAWNDASQPRRSWKCFQLWKCSRPQLKVPDPKELLSQRAAPAAAQK